VRAGCEPSDVTVALRLTPCLPTSTSSPNTCSTRNAACRQARSVRRVHGLQWYIEEYTDYSGRVCGLCVSHFCRITLPPPTSATLPPSLVVTDALPRFTMYADSACTPHTHQTHTTHTPHTPHTKQYTRHGEKSARMQRGVRVLCQPRGSARLGVLFEDDLACATNVAPGAQ
jgi:hypothetical protein